jgi:hypothetical protein
MGELEATPRRELIDRFDGGTLPAAHPFHMGCREAKSQDGRVWWQSLERMAFSLFTLGVILCSLVR